MGRMRNKLVFEESMQLCREDASLKEGIIFSSDHQECIPYSADIVVPESRGYDTEVTVVNDRSMNAAISLPGRVCVHNFASFTHPGGGVANGSSAQEESLCRISTLYPCISSERMMSLFYDPHRRFASGTYNSDIIYTPDIIVFRRDDSDMGLIPPEARYKVDVITCAAPNLNIVQPSPNEQYALMYERIGRIMDVAANNGADSLVLGAFGCGVFMNDPSVVAEASKDALRDHPGSFRKVVFAIYGNDRNLEAFGDVFH